MTIARAEVALRGKDETAAAFRNVVRNAESAQKQIATKLRSAFALFGVGTAIYGITRAVSNAIKAGDDLAKFAQKSGLAAQAASELAHAAKMTDVDLGALETGIKKMQVTVSQAGSGLKTATTTLRALGLEFKDLQILSPDQQFELIAEQISRLKDPADRTRAAVELFGRAGANLLPLFEQGAAGIRAAREEAQRLGKSFSAEDLKRFQDADDAMKRLDATSSNFANTLALKLGPAWSAFLDQLRVSMGGGTDRENAIQMLENEIFMLQRFGNSAEKLAQLKSRLEILQNPKSDPLAGRGRVANLGEEPPGFTAPMGDLDKLKPVVVTAKKILTDFGAMLRNTATDAQKAALEYQKFRIELEQLIEVGLIDQAEFDKRMKAYLDDNLKKVEVTAQRIQTVNDKTKAFLITLNDEMTRENFGALRDLIYDLASGADDFGDHMIDAFKRILANYATTQFFGMLAGAQKALAGKTGFLGAVSGFLGNLLGGPKAEGGPVSAGRVYPVGERGMELFAPNTSGTIIPNHKLGGSITFAPVTNVHVDSRADRAAIRQDVLAISDAVSRRHVEGFRDYLSRGGRL